LNFARYAKGQITLCALKKDFKDTEPTVCLHLYLNIIISNNRESKAELFKN
jgi:hypothetical protein